MEYDSERRTQGPNTSGSSRGTQNKDPVSSGSFQFDLNVWLGDPMLRQCSLAAQMAWLIMCALIEKARDRGRLVVGGRPWAERELAPVLGVDRDQALALLRELYEASVYSLDDDGCIFSRRLRRKYPQDDQIRSQGDDGGSACKYEENSGTGLEVSNLSKSSRTRYISNKLDSRDSGYARDVRERGDDFDLRDDDGIAASNIHVIGNLPPVSQDADDIDDDDLSDIELNRLCLSVFGKRPRESEIVMLGSIAHIRDLMRAGCDLRSHILPFIAMRTAKANLGLVRYWTCFPTVAILQRRDRDLAVHGDTLVDAQRRASERALRSRR